MQPDGYVGDFKSFFRSEHSVFENVKLRKIVVDSGTTAWCGVFMNRDGMALMLAHIFLLSCSVTICSLINKLYNLPIISVI